jgi:hypothetical protein
MRFAGRNPPEFGANLQGWPTPELFVAGAGPSVHDVSEIESGSLSSFLTHAQYIAMPIIGLISSPFTTTSGSLVDIPGGDVPLIAGQHYAIKAYLDWASASNLVYFNAASGLGLATSELNLWAQILDQLDGVLQFTNILALPGGVSGSASSDFGSFEIDGVITPSSAGTLKLQAANGTDLVPLTIKAGSYIAAYPL